MKRNEKLAHEFGKQVALAISQVFSLQESGLFTVREVSILSDFSEARIWISRVGGAPDFFDRLEHAKSKVGKKVFENIKMKKTPKLIFTSDNTGENIEKMEEMIRE